MLYLLLSLYNIHDKYVNTYKLTNSYHTKVKVSKETVFVITWTVVTSKLHWRQVAFYHTFSTNTLVVVHIITVHHCKGDRITVQHNIFFL